MSFGVPSCLKHLGFCASFTDPGFVASPPKGSAFLCLDERSVFGVSVGLLVCGHPLEARALGEHQFVPTFGFVGVVIGGNHGPVGRGDKDGVADGEVGLLCLRLGFFHHVPVVKDAVDNIHNLALDGDGIGP